MAVEASPPGQSTRIVKHEYSAHVSVNIPFKEFQMYTFIQHSFTFSSEQWICCGSWVLWHKLRSKMSTEPESWRRIRDHYSATNNESHKCDSSVLYSSLFDTCTQIIYRAPMTLAVKGQMMMMMMTQTGGHVLILGWSMRSHHQIEKNPWFSVFPCGIPSLPFTVSKCHHSWHH